MSVKRLAIEICECSFYRSDSVCVSQALAFKQKADAIGSQPHLLTERATNFPNRCRGFKFEGDGFVLLRSDLQRFSQLVGAKTTVAVCMGRTLMVMGAPPSGLTPPSSLPFGEPASFSAAIANREAKLPTEPKTQNAL